METNLEKQFLNTPRITLLIEKNLDEKVIEYDLENLKNLLEKWFTKTLPKMSTFFEAK